jgi:hypothetical protein
VAVVGHSTKLRLILGDDGKAFMVGFFIMITSKELQKDVRPVRFKKTSTMNEEINPSLLLIS